MFKRPKIQPFKIIRILLLVVVITSTSLASAPALAATSLPKTSYFESFIGDYYLDKDSDGSSILRVVETITAVFPTDSEEHGITRQLVYTGKTDLSDNKTLSITATRNGKPENIALIEDRLAQSTIGDDYHYFDIRIGNANHTVSGKQTYTLEYTYRNVIDDFDGIQELYWNANGTGWSKTIRNLTARVHFGQGVAKDFLDETACYVGRYGTSGAERCITSYLDDGIEFATTGKYLYAGENLTFALAFDENSFKTNSDGYTLDTKAYTDYRLIGVSIVAVIIGGILIALTLFTYYKTSDKRKYYKGLFIKPEYTPPHDLLVAEMAENYIGSANGSQQVATLMELAVNHQIEMIKSEEDGLLGKKKTIWKVRIKTDKLKKEQAIVLKILAGSTTPLRNGQEITIKSHTATSELTKLSTDFKTAIENRLEAAGLYESKTPHKPTKTKKKFSLASLGLVLGIIWIPAWFFAAAFVFDEDSLPSYVTLAFPILLPTLIILIIVVAIVTIYFNWKTIDFEKRTLKGLEYSRYMDGLKMYIKMAEADRLKMLQSVEGADTSHEGVVKIYEKLLPYAVAFRLEKSWLEELSRYYELDDVSTPVWYVGMGAFSARDFTSAMHSINTSASSAIISTSSSGSSGGIGGGGFSGGGGGGGGGGTW